MILVQESDFVEVVDNSGRVKFYLWKNSVVVRAVEVFFRRWTNLLYNYSLEVGRVKCINWFGREIFLHFVDT